MVEKIASVRAGNFTAWFEKVDDHFEVQWYDNHSPKAFSFPTKQKAQEFWHEFVIDAKNIQYCYCC